MLESDRAADWRCVAIQPLRVSTRREDAVDERSGGALKDEIKACGEAGGIR